jgi:excisionase family DNA binding protein
LKEHTSAKPSLLMTIPQVQHELQCSRSTVYVLLGAKNLVAVKVKGATRIKRAALIRYIDQNTLEGTYAA